jgi:hypothetical protein
LLRSILPKQGGATLDELVAWWPVNVESEQGLRKELAIELDFLFRQVRVVREGTNGRGDPYRYRHSETKPEYYATTVPGWDDPTISTEEEANEEGGDLEF